MTKAARCTFLAPLVIATWGRGARGSIGLRHQVFGVSGLFCSFRLGRKLKACSAIRCTPRTKTRRLGSKDSYNGAPYKAVSIRVLINASYRGFITFAEDPLNRLRSVVL